MSKTIFIEENEKKDTVDKSIMPYSLWHRKKTKGQTFGRPKLKKAGKEFDVHDWIQEGREDTEIYATLEKYGCLDRMETDANTLYGDMSEISDLRNVIEQAQRADEMWNSLPLELRREFQHNKSLFMENGKDYLEKIIKKSKETGSEIENKGENSDA